MEKIYNKDYIKTFVFFQMSDYVFLLGYLVNIIQEALEYGDCVWFRTSTKISPKMSRKHQWVVTNTLT